ncbi:MAG: hypothetical protein R2705_14570 [Ilumatobacteraceae bacterium]
MTADRDELKRRVCAEVDRLAGSLVAASRSIHAHPELAYQERHAHDVLTDLLEREGLTPERHAYGIETAFRASGDRAGPRSACCASTTPSPGSVALRPQRDRHRGTGRWSGRNCGRRGRRGRVVIYGTPPRRAAAAR